MLNFSLNDKMYELEIWNCGSFNNVLKALGN